MFEYILALVLIILIVLIAKKFFHWNKNRKIDKLWKETCAYARLHHLDREMLRDKSLETIKNFCDAQFKHPHLTLEVQIKMKELKQQAERLS